jgi:arylsulfatase A-like enzyme
MSEEMSQKVRVDISRWAFAALAVGIVDGLFAYLTFDVFPLVQAATAILSCVIFALAAAPAISIFSLSPGREESMRQAAVLSAFLALLGFFDCAVLMRRTPYFFQLFGQGIWLIAVSGCAALLLFLVSKRLLQRAGKPVPLFLASAVVFQCAFLFLRYVNHYQYSSIFYEPPALLYNALLAALFFPVLYVASRLLAQARVRSWIERWETGGRTLLILVITILFYLGSRMWGVSLPGDLRSPNILLIVMDTMRSDHLSSYGYEVATSPHIDSLAAEGALFTKVIATAPWTVPTHSSMFTGLYPSSHGAHWEHMYLDGSLKTVAELLHEEGYQTVGFSNNPVVSHATNLSQGFEDFYEMWRNTSRFPTLYSEVKDWLVCLAGRDDVGAGRTNEMIKGWIERKHRKDRPFFMFVNYLEVHLTYNPPIHYRKKFLPDSDVVEKMKKVSIRTLYRILLEQGLGGFHLSPEEIRVLEKLYDAEITYLDSRIGELMHYLRSCGILDTTFLILTSDHGENIGEHGLIDHQLNLYDPLLRIPLIMRYPPLVQGGLRVGSLVQSVDVFSTLLEVGGASGRNPGYSVQGMNLLEALAGGLQRDYAFAEYMSPRSQFDTKVRNWVEAKGEVADLSPYDRRLKTVRTDTLKYVWSSNGKDELYDLSSDPGELENLIGTGHGSPDAMRKKLEEWQRALPKVLEGSGEIPEMDRETRDLLKALGYID